MTNPDLSRELVRAVVEQLVAHKHLIVMPGKTSDLVAELAPLGVRAAALLGEHSSQTVLDGLEETVADLAEQLLDSAHVEEVFAEDRVVRRESLRVLREGLTRAIVDARECRPTISIELERLPQYVLVLPEKLADQPTLRAAFERAGDRAGADLTHYDEGDKRVVYELWNQEPSDERIGLQDAVAEELAHAGFARFVVDLKESDLQEPLPRAARAGATSSSPEPELASFQDFNFKLAVLQVLMFETTAIRPRFDVHTFARQENLNLDELDDRIIPMVREHFERLAIPVALLDGITSLAQDGGDEIYAQLSPGWDGEDRRFSIHSAGDSKWLRNLRRVSLFHGDPAVLEGFRRLGIEAKWT